MVKIMNLINVFQGARVEFEAVAMIGEIKDI